MLGHLPSWAALSAAAAGSPGLAATFLAALGGFVLGSLQSLFLDWARHRSQHKRHLRALRAELLRLGAYTAKFDWTLERGVPNDTVPNPPRVTASYERLLQDVDFWLTDEHSEDNTLQGLIDISDGVLLLQRYSSNVLGLTNEMRAAADPKAKQKLATRVIETSQAYDKELNRWLIMVRSAVLDVARRLRVARLTTQVARAFRSMPSGTNPPSLPPAFPDA